MTGQRRFAWGAVHGILYAQAIRCAIRWIRPAATYAVPRWLSGVLAAVFFVTSVWIQVAKNPDN